MYILLFLLFLFIVLPVILVVLKLAGAIFRARGFNAAGRSAEKTFRSPFNTKKKQKKVFSENEGEYVDFVEVKEDEAEDKEDSR